jgi:biopolymer transport protein TolR
MVTPTNNKKSGRRQLNFDLNLVPFIDMLSVCICFLLVTAVFMQLGTVNVRQALGDGAAAKTREEPALWLRLQDNGTLQVTVKNVKASRASEFVVPAAGGSEPDWARFSSSLSIVKRTYPNLGIALVMPSAQTRYENVIQAMDRIKKVEIAQVGIAPL